MPSDRDIVAAVSDHAVIDDSDDEHEIGACNLESERPIVTTKDVLRAIKVITQYYDAHGSDDNLDINCSVLRTSKGECQAPTSKQTLLTF